MRPATTSFCSILFLLIPFALLAYFSYAYNVSQSDIKPAYATILDANPQAAGSNWVVVTKYNFTTASNVTVEGIDAKHFSYDSRAAFEFAKQKHTEIFYRLSNPDVNGFLWFLDLTWWIVGVVIFAIVSILAFIPLILFCCEFASIVNDGITACCRKEKKKQVDLFSDNSTSLVAYPPSAVETINTLQYADDVKGIAEKI